MTERRRIAIDGSGENRFLTGLCKIFGLQEHSCIDMNIYVEIGEAVRVNVTFRPTREQMQELVKSGLLDEIKQEV